jgi:hypothetical protein
MATVSGEPDDLIDWRPSDEKCQECGADTLIGDWWDDEPEAGGACIGSLHKCTKCDWFAER